MSFIGFVNPLVDVGGSIIGSIAGDNPDLDRFEKTKGWYRDALAGDLSDACRLKYYSGRFGSHDCGTGVISGWATQPAKDYAYLLYNQYSAIKAGQIPASTPIPEPNTIPAWANTVATISEVAGAVAVGAGQVAAQGGAQTTTTRVQAALDTSKWVGLGLLVLVVGVLAYKSFRK